MYEFYVQSVIVSVFSVFWIAKYLTLVQTSQVARLKRYTAIYPERCLVYRPMADIWFKCDALSITVATLPLAKVFRKLVNLDMWPNSRAVQ